ncbi:MAG: U32 family peptidase [Actinobacteria bacterium]|nr:U32 family peptidase [Actinomycetota bacterium]
MEINKKYKIYNNKFNIPELCVPAGNLNILKYAVAYGADAVYIGGSRYNLRSFGENFSITEFKKAVTYAHERNVKIYLTLNAIINESELAELKKYIIAISKIEFDAVIISDPSVFEIVKDLIPAMRLHISTQASISNSIAVNFWARLGAQRVNLARELSYEEISQIVKKSKIDIEVFVHGALCISYSGRCMLSKYLTGRDANKGQCSHTCRWKYYLMEEKRPNMFLPVDMDKRGTYIYNSRDLCLLEKLELICKSGVSSIKIEGRMKTENYVAQVTWVYRQALDMVKSGSFTAENKKYLLEELDKTTHRSFTEGFMFLPNKKHSELTGNDNVGYIKKYRFAGSVEFFSDKYGINIIKARNQFKKGQTLDLIQPGKKPSSITLKSIINFNTLKEVDVVNTNDLVIINELGNFDEFSLLRVKL